MTANTNNNAGNDASFDLDVVGSLIDQVESYGDAFVRSLPSIIAAIIVLVVAWIAVRVLRRVIKKAMTAANLRKALVRLAQTLISVVVWMLAILISMSMIFPSVDPGSVLTALGVGGIAVGFAFKDIFENFMAGAMIMLRKPMRIGDFIECQEVEGKIEEIHIRDTYVRQTDGQLILVPNSVLYKNPVFIRTERNIRRFEITAGVGYDVDVDAARDVIREAVEDCGAAESDPPVQVQAKEFNSSSVDFQVRWWARSEPADFYKSRDVVIAAVKKALEAADMEIPYPYRTLTFKQPLALENGTPATAED